MEGTHKPRGGEYHGGGYSCVVPAGAGIHEGDERPEQEGRRHQEHELSALHDLAPSRRRDDLAHADVSAADIVRAFGRPVKLKGAMRSTFENSVKAKFSRKAYGPGPKGLSQEEP